MARPRKNTNDFAAGVAAAADFLRTHATQMLRTRECNAHQWAELQNAAQMIEAAYLQPVKEETKPAVVNTTTTTD